MAAGRGRGPTRPTPFKLSHYRLPGSAAKNTVAKLLVDLGAACEAYQARVMVGLQCERLQCDEIWSFVYSKAKNVPEEHAGEWGYGDVWTWTAIDADTKLVPSCGSVQLARQRAAVPCGAGAYGERSPDRGSTPPYPHALHLGGTTAHQRRSTDARFLDHAHRIKLTHYHLFKKRRSGSRYGLASTDRMGMRRL